MYVWIRQLNKKVCSPTTTMLIANGVVLLEDVLLQVINLLDVTSIVRLSMVSTLYGAGDALSFAYCPSL